MVVANKVKTVTHFDTAYWLFLLSVILLPIGLAGNRPIPFGIAQAGLTLSCLFLLLGRKEWTPPTLFPRLKAALALFAVVSAWAFIQTQPFVPQSWVHPLWKEASDVLRHPLKGAISISPEDSLLGLNRLITYIFIGFLAYIFGQDPKRARQMVTGLWLSCIVICLYGLLEFISGSNSILWFKKWAYETDVTATFVNRNHYAIYCGMALVSGAALAVQSWREKVAAQNLQVRSQVMREWLVREGALRCFSLALIVLCIVLSHSRSGLVLAFTGLGAYFFFYQIYRRAFARALFTALAGFIIVVLVVITAMEFTERFPNLFVDYSSRDRLKVYELSLRALHDNMWLGYGLGSFQPVFRLYERGMAMEFMHAHSDYLESLLDLGIPAGIMLWAALLLLISGMARGVARRRRHGIYPCLGLAASIIVFTHCMIDFSTQIPGVICTWALLAGCALAQSWRHTEKTTAHEWVE